MKNGAALVTNQSVLTRVSICWSPTTTSTRIDTVIAGRT